mmetsp:Transcript_23254/g.25920  ORF Transcript_23254/g.25920 Transcript_23254/m.25920 type:complete len:109 (-) Transcript_23254:145-471(-)
MRVGSGVQIHVHAHAGLPGGRVGLVGMGMGASMGKNCSSTSDEGQNNKALRTCANQKLGDDLLLLLLLLLLVVSMLLFCRGGDLDLDRDDLDLDFDDPDLGDSDRDNR